MLRNLTALTVLVPTLWMISAQALGLGDIELRSRLNQRFLATIPVLEADPEDLESLKVSLAPDDAFARAGIDRSGLVSTLKFVLGVGGIKISSDQVVRDPFVNFIVQARWNGGRFLREYTVLLDPPGEPAAVAPAAVPAAAIGESPSDVSDAAAAAPPDANPDTNPSARPYELAATAPAQAEIVTAAPGAVAGFEVGDVYGPVLETQTLWSIARELRLSSEVTMEQMVLAIYQTNPQAFGGGSINRLLSGSLLKVPTAGQVVAVDAATAHSRVAELRGQPLTAPAASPARTSTAVAVKPRAPVPAPVLMPDPTAALAEASPAPVLTPEAAEPEASLPSAASPVEPAVETPPVSAPEPIPEPIPDSTPAPIAEASPAPSTLSADDTGLPLPLIGGLLALILLLLALVLRKRRAQARPNSARAAAPVWLPMPVVADAPPEIQRSTAAAVAEPEVVRPAPVVLPEPEPPVLAEPKPELLPLPEDRAEAASDLKLDAGDPLTEADFHLAYGLHDEAIQMLKTAIAEAPERADLQQKLAEVYAAAAAAKTPVAELSVVDFDLDADLAKPEAKPETPAEISPDIVAPATVAATPPPVVAAEPEPEGPRNVEPLADIDLSSFDLDTESSGEPPLDPRLIEFNLDELEASTEPEPDHPLSASGDEIDTKLDLARAYVDMGDIEAADNLLIEVMASGSDAQKAEAEALKLRPKDAG